MLTKYISRWVVEKRCRQKTKKDSKEESERDDSNKESLLTSRMSALLDFYCDRAVAHASFFFASVFDIITILAVILQLGENNVSFFLFPIPLVWLSIPVFLFFHIWDIIAYSDSIFMPIYQRS